jgi:hypothetical protein
MISHRSLASRGRQASRFFGEMIEYSLNRSLASTCALTDRAGTEVVRLNAGHVGLLHQLPEIHVGFEFAPAILATHWTASVPSFFASSMTSSFILRSPSDSTALTRSMPSGSVLTSSASASAESLSPRMPSARACNGAHEGVPVLETCSQSVQVGGVDDVELNQDTLLPTLVEIHHRRGMFQVAVIVER